MKTLNQMKKQLTVLVMLCLSQTGLAALVDMAEYRDWEGVRDSISTEDVNAVQPDGMSALFWAVYYDETDVVELLLNAGADANIANRYGMTPLIQASMNGNGQVISMLLDAGAEPDTLTLQGDNALMNAAKSGTVEGVQALVEAGANVNVRDSYLFQTPLMWAAAENNAEVARILIENGADFNARSAELSFAGVRGGGVAGDFPNGGLTALHHAARENSIATVDVLLSMGADPNILDPQGISPLRVAAQNANLDLAKILIEGGADLNDGALVDVMEVEYKTWAFVRAEKNYNNTTTVRDLMSLMFEMGVDVDSYPETAYPVPTTNFVGGGGTSGQTALYNATKEGITELMTLLLDHGANPNSLNSGNTPLTVALNVPAGGAAEDVTLEDQMPVVELLMGHGADVNARIGNGGTVLHQAAALGKDEVVTFLIESGADLSVKDDSNRTALDVASGVAAVGGNGGGRGRGPAETPVYESTMALLTEAMEAQGVAIEEYVPPPLEGGGNGGGRGRGRGPAETPVYEAAEA